ncbi:hypothetical protein LTR49_009929 [Elasticomyces elasticus]|nr:hypothetical protein LTR49_009929 [Elasticomyces elasticus]KAK5769425.1 hypothetical protein LTS12_000352 [Elasticomyces elasticus]
MVPTIVTAMLSSRAICEGSDHYWRHWSVPQPESRESSLPLQDDLPSRSKSQLLRLLGGLMSYLTGYHIEQNATEKDTNSTGSTVCPPLWQYADHAPRFHRFLELPPELRTQIFEYYIAPFTLGGLHAPTMPPATRICRQLRHDILPLFFTNCTFDIHFLQTYGRTLRWDDPYSSNLYGPPRPAIQLAVNPLTAQFYHGSDPTMLRRIRHLQICVPSLHELDDPVSDLDDGSFRSHISVWTVSIPNADGVVGVSYRVMKLTDGPRFVRRSTLEVDNITRCIIRVLEPMLDREVGGFRRFGMREVYAIRKAIEIAMLHGGDC